MRETIDQREMVSLAEACREYGVSRATLYRYISRGDLHSFKRGGDRRSYLSRDQLEQRLGGFHPRPARRHPQPTTPPARQAAVSPSPPRRPGPPPRSAYRDAEPLATDSRRSPTMPVNWLPASQGISDRLWPPTSGPNFRVLLRALPILLILSLLIFLVVLYIRT